MTSGRPPGRMMIVRGDAYLEVLIQGEGCPIVLLPSLGRGAADFDAIAARLAEASYRVLRPQPRGIGASRGPWDGVKLEDLAADIAAKRLALLHELVPAVALIAMLVNPGNPEYARNETRNLQSAARALGIRVLVLNGGTGSDVAAAFATLVEQHAGALMIGADTIFYGARDQIMSLAARNAIPTMFFDTASVAAGGLLSYGPDLRG